MARTKKVEMVSQVIHLSPKVKVTIETTADEWPVIQWNGPRLAVSLQGSASPEMPSDWGNRRIDGSHNALPSDSPEIVAAREALGARQPLTSAEVARSMGLPDLTQQLLGNNSSIPPGAISNEDVDA